MILIIERSIFISDIYINAEKLCTNKQQGDVCGEFKKCL